MVRGNFRDKSRSVPSSKEKTLTVSKLTQSIKLLLESKIANVSVSGEISNYNCAPSGHIYFTLKDSTSSIACVMFKQSAMKMKCELSDGDEVIVSGRVSVYEQRGAYQIIANKMELAGKGDLFAKFEKLKKRLSVEGLFDLDKKISLPKYPKCVGVVTSFAAAALQDVLTTIALRNPSMNIIVSQTSVQGSGSELEIADALKRLDKTKECDVILLVRGGGSYEDLWSFNEEVVVRAVAKCSTPIVVGVGHEVDFSLSDAASDIRASTPTAAAEIAVPKISDIQESLSNSSNLLKQGLVRYVEKKETILNSLAESAVLSNPYRILEEPMQHVDRLEQRLTQHGEKVFSSASNKLNELTAQLHALSPLGVIARGYSLSSTLSGNVVRMVDDVSVNDEILTRVKDGKITSTVKEIIRDGGKNGES